MTCQNCQFWCDSEDVFCRKCGASLFSEADFKEIEAEAIQTAVEPSQVVTPEVISLATTTPVPAIEPVSHTPNLPVKAGAVTSKFLGLAAKALNSEEGRAIIKAATMTAVGVGLELLAKSHQKAQPTQIAPVPEPLNLAEFVEPTQNLAPGTTVVETWMYRYTYTKRVVRRVR